MFNSPACQFRRATPLRKFEFCPVERSPRRPIYYMTCNQRYPNYGILAMV